VFTRHHTAKTIHRVFLFGLVLIVGLPLPLVARAHGEAVVARPAKLTPAQLTAFSELVSEPESEVNHRLQANPSLLPLAARAVDARTKRTSVGRALSVGGFTLFAIGMLVGGAMVLSGVTPDHSCPYEGGSTCDSGDNDGEVHAGFLIMLASAGLGLGAGITGLVYLRRPDAVENEAHARYVDIPPRQAPFGAVRGGAGNPRRTMTFPLVSLSF
jgi:hypothetical protein